MKNEKYYYEGISDEELVKLNEKLIWKVTHKFANNKELFENKGNLSIEDLYQEAAIELVRAREKFIPGISQFSTYAWTRMYNRLKSFIVRYDRKNTIKKSEIKELRSYDNSLERSSIDANNHKYDCVYDKYSDKNIVNMLNVYKERISHLIDFYLELPKHHKIDKNKVLGVFEMISICVLDNDKKYKLKNYYREYGEKSGLYTNLQDFQRSSYQLRIFFVYGLKNLIDEEMLKSRLVIPKDPKAEKLAEDFKNLEASGKLDEFLKNDIPKILV